MEDACGENYIVSNYSEILHDESVDERALNVEKGDCSLNHGAEVEPSVPLQGTGEKLPS